MKKIFKKDNNYKFLKILFLAWIIAFVVIGIAFSSATSRLTAEGTATIQSHIYDYVYITSASIYGSSGGSSVNYSFLDHELKANVSTPSCNNYVTYKLDIVNTTPYKAYITSAGLASAVNGSGNPTSSFSVEFIDASTNSAVVANSTYIAAHSTKSIYVKIKNNCSGSDTSGVVTANFQYSLYKYYDLTITPTPSDSTVTLTTLEGTFSGTGTLTHRVMETDVVSYSVSKDGYYTSTNSYTMGKANHNINVTLEEVIKTYTLTFNANGGSVSTSSKTVTYGSTLGDLPTPTKANATFIGWFDEKYKTHPVYYYADAYSDLYNAFGYNESNLYKHYADWGKNEGRRISQYLSTDIVNFNGNKTIYAGWIYIWEKWNTTKVWDTTLIGTTTNNVWAGTWINYIPRADLGANIQDDNMIHWTTGQAASIVNPLPDSATYYFAANEGSIRTHSSQQEDTTNTYCIITNKKVTIYSTITCDIYKISNVRLGKGSTSVGTVYDVNSSAYPASGLQDGYWYEIK